MVAPSDRNIVLTGFMGTGKSVVGRALAEATGFGWVDTDRMIQDRHGAIPDIFEHLGESMFRSIERNIAAEVAGLRRHVVSTGGRMLLDDDNVRAFADSSRIFCLAVDEDELIARLISSSTPRPLLAGPEPEERIRELLAERASGYRRFPQLRSRGGPPATTAAAATEIIRRSTATARGHVGVAVLPYAATAVDRAAVLCSDPAVAAIHGPSVGPTADRFDDAAEVPPGSAVILLGGTSVTDAAAELLERGCDVVVAPTTPAAMLAQHPEPTTVIVDLATLQTLDGPALREHGLPAFPVDVTELLPFAARVPE